MRLLSAAVYLGFSITLLAGSGQNNTRISFSNPAMQEMQFFNSQNTNYMFFSLSALNSNYSYTGSAYNSNGSAADARKNVLPEFEYVKKYDDKWIFALKYGVPLFFRTGYDDVSSFAGPFAVDRTIRASDFSPELSYKINQKFSVGAGLDLIQLKLKIYDAIPSSGLLKNNLQDNKVGYHLGLLVNQPWRGSFVGLSYYSPVGFDLKGLSVLGTNTRSISSYLKSPWNVRLELLQAVSQSEMLFLNWQYTNWKSVDSITISGGQIPSITETLGYKSTSQTSLGAIINKNGYRIITGLSYDISPAPAEHRTANSLEPPTFWTGGVDISKIYNGNRVGIAYGRLLNHRQYEINGTDYVGRLKVNEEMLSLYFSKSF